MFNSWKPPQQIVTCSNMTQKKNIAVPCTNSHMVCTQLLWRKLTQKQASILNPTHTNTLFFWPLCIIDEPPSIPSAILLLLSSLPVPILSIVWYLCAGMSLTPHLLLSALSRHLLYHFYPSFPIFLLLLTLTFSPPTHHQLGRPVILCLLSRCRPVTISGEGWGNRLTAKFDCQLKKTEEADGKEVAVITCKHWNSKSGYDGILGADQLKICLWYNSTQWRKLSSWIMHAFTGGMALCCSNKWIFLVIMDLSVQEFRRFYKYTLRQNIIMF